MRIKDLTAFNPALFIAEDVGINLKQSLLRVIKSVRKELLILFFLSIITITSIDFYLIKIPEFFDGGAKVGKIIYRLSLSYISAFIFYFIVIHIKREKDKRILFPYITKKTNHLIGDCKSMFKTMAKEANVDLSSAFPTAEELKQICSNIDPRQKGPMIMNQKIGYGNWYHYLNYLRIRSKNHTEKIFKQIQILDPELIRLISQVEDTHLFSLIELSAGNTFNSSTLTGFNAPMEEYLKRISELNSYYEERLTDYQ